METVHPAPMVPQMMFKVDFIGFAKGTRFLKWLRGHFSETKGKN